MPNNIGSGENTDQMDFDCTPGGAETPQPSISVPDTLNSQEVVAQQESPVLPEFPPEQLREHRQELLQKRKVFTQSVLDVIYETNKNDIQIDPAQQAEYEITVENARAIFRKEVVADVNERVRKRVIAIFLKESLLDDSKFEDVLETVVADVNECARKRAQRLATARFLKESVLDNIKLKAILDTQLSDTDSSGKVHRKKIKALPYIKSILARLRVNKDRIITEDRIFFQIFFLYTFRKISKLLKIRSSVIIRSLVTLSLAKIDLI